MKLANRALNISPSPTLAIDSVAKEMIAKGMSVVSFAAGEPDFDTPDHIKEAAVAAIRAGKTKYTPVAGTSQLREVICTKLKTDQGLDYTPDQIVVSAGAKHSLYNAMQVLVQPGDEVILPAPYWVSYLEQIKLAGAEARIVPAREENGFKLTPAELQAAISNRTRLLILNSPSNPTGAVYTADELGALAAVIEKYDFMVISDEIYEKFIYNGTKLVSIASLSPGLKERTVVINGVSKTYAMTGWRIGYAAAAKPVAKAMGALQGHSTSNPTSIAQDAALAAIGGDQAPVALMMAEYSRRRNFILERLNAIPGISCFKPGGSFYVFPSIKHYVGKSYKGRTISGATDLASVLLEEAQVAIVPGIAFGDDNYIRLSYVCSMEKIEDGLNRIAGLLKLIK
ncbi:pyridoxal phosphate-dependent aminotransferase [Pelotomaculum propionicicum]|uniref:Aminotransferase n=1 Tax=Pelotomaculum propionicicum TaxID=258475 RepID=A0A4Y7RP00_9FIRM|nr:pyridoxal phosphate-dependent aminotransferase [Pelotomaculum propionicicum]NLI12788.1 pyridoxal phosphate-dependent aminotransferase [Peptococcaceae bacterium]TEB10583.1 Aspartate aminotransferase [Pelotomaculum propionicicum]